MLDVFNIVKSTGIHNRHKGHAQIIAIFRDFSQAFQHIAGFFSAHQYVHGNAGSTQLHRMHHGIGEHEVIRFRAHFDTSIDGYHERDIILDEAGVHLFDNAIGHEKSFRLVRGQHFHCFNRIDDTGDRAQYCRMIHRNHNGIFAFGIQHSI